MKSFLYAAAFALGLCSAQAGAAEPDLLMAEQAFRPSVRALDARHLEVRFDIARGYYLYRDKLSFAVSNANIELGTAKLPRGKLKQDEFFGRVEVYRNSVTVRVPVKTTTSRFVLMVNSQGCADIGVCYPPTTQALAVELPRAD